MRHPKMNRRLVCESVCRRQYRRRLRLKTVAIQLIDLVGTTHLMDVTSVLSALLYFPQIPVFLFFLYSIISSIFLYFAWKLLVSRCFARLSFLANHPLEQSNSIISHCILNTRNYMAYG